MKKQKGKQKLLQAFEYKGITVNPYFYINNSNIENYEQRIKELVTNNFWIIK